VIQSETGGEDLRRLVWDGIQAFRLTREYVGEDVLPAIEGWSWFDWCERAERALGIPPFSTPNVGATSSPEPGLDVDRLSPK
jgi:hypothetical protein